MMEISQHFQEEFYLHRGCGMIQPDENKRRDQEPHEERREQTIRRAGNDVDSLVVQSKGNRNAKGHH